ncbi:hypothetical protein DXG01_013279 [Tephrocybe rancida]|nr:hypothetical protein DXG01_013279 [Tephrocybe rancida]
MSLGKVGQVSVQTAKKVFTGDYVIPNRIALYGIPKLITPGDIRRALPEKVQGVTNIEIDYRAFRPSRKAVITFSRPEALSGNLRALRPFTVCGTELDAAPHYGLDTLQGTRPRTKVIDGNGLDARFPNIDRSVVLWGMPMGVTIDDISRTLGSEFKVALKDGKPILHKVER